MNRSLLPHLSICRSMLIIALFSVFAIFLFTEPNTGSPTAAQNLPTIPTATPLPTLVPILGRVPITVSNTAQVKQIMQIGKGGAVDVCWSPDGNTLGVATTLGLLLYDPTNWAIPPREFGPTAALTACSWSPHGNYITLSAADISAQTVWRTEILNFTNGATFKSFPSLTTVQWSPNGKEFATTDSAGHTALWDGISGKLLRQISAAQVTWSPDGQFAALIGYGFILNVWSTETNRFIVGPLLGWNRAIWAANRSKLAVMDLLGEIGIAAVDPQKPMVDSFDLLDNGQYGDFSWAPDSIQMATIDNYGTMQIWNTTTKNVIKTYSQIEGSSIAWSPRSQIIAVGFRATPQYSTPQYITFIDNESGQLVRQSVTTNTPVDKYPTDSDYLQGISEFKLVSWSPAGHYLLLDRSLIQAGDYYDDLTFNKAGNYSALPDWSDAIIFPYSFSPDEKKVAYITYGVNYSQDEPLKKYGYQGGYFGQVAVQDLSKPVSQSNSAIKLFANTLISPYVAWSPSGQILASRFYTPDPNDPTYGRTTVQFWNLSDHTLNHETVANTDFIWGVNDQIFATAGAASLAGSYFGISSGSKKFYWGIGGHPPPDQQMALSSDAHLLAFDGGKSVGFWQVTNPTMATYADSGVAYYFWDGHTDTVNTVAFSPDGTILASGSADKTIRLWNVASGQTIRVLSGHTESVNRVAFSHDGKFLASASDDQTVRIWDVNTGNLIKTLIGHTGAVTRVQWSPDGSLVASASADGTIKLWDVTSGSLLTTLTGHTTAINDISWSPDGKTIASAGADATIRLWGVP